MEGIRSIVGQSVQGSGAERRPDGRDRRWLRSRVTRVTHALGRRAGQRGQRSLKALCSLSPSSTTSRPPGRERAVADSDRGQCWGRARCAIKTLKRDCNACPLPRFPAFLTSPSLQVFTSPFLSPHSSGDPIRPPASRSSRFPRIFIPILPSTALYLSSQLHSYLFLFLLFLTAVCLSHQSLENSA